MCRAVIGAQYTVSAGQQGHGAQLRNQLMPFDLNSLNHAAQPSDANIAKCTGVLGVFTAPATDFSIWAK